MTCNYYRVDIDECEENTDGCEYNCTNTMGSFICTCPDGFEVGSDDRSCVGI